ncbi:MAG TPA: HAD family phosphatase [Candidatus Aerophobetes bacterium]|uniref:HAD family phosphatase n=1 Tax=Aerophobetes bacterium TaxID=2030807 RepID=A0A7V5I012_UNCAE|nr:HAD family phosphatase [Candidatus Aerophobetes bacterium]
MDLKLVACDLDNTLMEGVPIQPEVKDFIVKIRKKGIKFVINSGRCLENILEVLSESKVPCPEGYPEAIISMHGIFIHYLKGNNYVEDEEWNKEKRKELEILKQEIGWKSKMWEKMIEDKLKIKPLRKEIDQGVFRVLFNNKEEAERAKEAITKETRFKYVTFLRNKHLLLATLSTAQKGHSLLRVARHFNLSPGEILAIGDSHNDIDMLNGRYGFVPAAPSNAEEEVKSLVKSKNGYVASLAEGKGVIEIVNLLLHSSKK